jgi:hypothetical protein
LRHLFSQLAAMKDFRHWIIRNYLSKIIIPDSIILGKARGTRDLQSAAWG